MSRRDLVRAVEWCLLWDHAYRVMQGTDSPTYHRHRGLIDRRRDLALHRLRGLWLSSGHFWVDGA